MSDCDGGTRCCVDCGGAAAVLSAAAYCLVCEEVHARVDAAVGAAMADLVDRVISVAVDYLHPADIRATLDDHAGRLSEYARRSGEESACPRRNEERFRVARRVKAARIEACGGAAMPPMRETGDR